MAKPKQGLDNGVIASLGKQLTDKVDNGRLTRGQATKVKDQRTLLAKAFGPDWRVKVYGKGGAKSYPTLGYKGPTELNSIRKKALKRAQAKIAGKTAGSPNNGSVEAPPPGINKGSERVQY